MNAKIFSVFCVLSSMAFCAPSYNDYKTHFEKYEGKKNTLYKCSMGYLTVGIGHKFEKGEKTKRFYSNSEVDAFFKKDLEEAKVIAKRVFPSFNSQPDKVQILLVSLCFNLGEGGINKFKNFKKAIHNKRYDVAAQELEDSRWYKQTGKRGISYVQKLKEIS
jgi:lysozyme